MKTLLLIRHAKSSWDEATMNDMDRPLNDRGKQNAPEMAHRILKKNIEIDAFITSPAKRAKKTAEFFAKEYGAGKKKIIVAQELYHATDEDFNKVITAADSQYDSIAVFSHNPGITDFANSLTTVRIDNMPTCSVFAVKADVKDWADFSNAEKEFYFFDFPKSGNT